MIERKPRNSARPPYQRKGTFRPKAVASILDSTLSAFRLSKQVEKYASFEYWPEVIGPEYARVTFPEKISRGKILVVKVENAALVQELTLLKHEILNKLSRLAVGAYIEDIRFTVSDPITIKKHLAK